MVTNADSKIDYIAEIGINHLGSLQLAKNHIVAAKKSGATIAKFQTYSTEKRVSTESPIYEILKQCELDFKSFTILKTFCDELGIEFASTPFCEESADFLASIGCKTVKVASFFLSNRHLLSRLFSDERFDRIIVSTGVSSIEQVLDANSLYESINFKRQPKLVFMHCISQYPVKSVADYNLINISYLAEATGKIVGYSDHSLGSFAPSIAVALGAACIEKHFSVDPQLPGADHAMSASPNTFADMVELCENTLRSLGTKRGSSCYDAERSIIQYRVVS